MRKRVVFFLVVVLLQNHSSTAELVKKNRIEAINMHNNCSLSITLMDHTEPSFQKKDDCDFGENLKSSNAADFYCSCNAESCYQQLGVLKLLESKSSQNPSRREFVLACLRRTVTPSPPKGHSKSESHKSHVTLLAIFTVPIGICFLAALGCFVVTHLRHALYKRSFNPSEMLHSAQDRHLQAAHTLRRKAPMPTKKTLPTTHDEETSDSRSPRKANNQNHPQNLTPSPRSMEEHPLRSNVQKSPVSNSPLPASTQKDNATSAMRLPVTLAAPSPHRSNTNCGLELTMRPMATQRSKTAPIDEDLPTQKSKTVIGTSTEGSNDSLAKPTSTTTKSTTLKMKAEREPPRTPRKTSPAAPHR